MLNEKVILITGANRGIGLATAQLCIEQGANVVVAGRDDKKLQQLASQLGEKCTSMGYDVSQPGEVKAAFFTLQQEFGRLDGLVNNAGIMLDAPLMMSKLDDLQAMLNTNTLASFQHMQLASRLMSRNKQGSMVNLCSIVGEQGSAGQSAYASSKAAVSGMTLSLAKELAPVGIRVNGIAPGFIETDLVSHYEALKKDEILSGIAMKRAGKAKEVAETICFLLSEKSSYITGQIIGVDGGMSL